MDKSSAAEHPRIKTVASVSPSRKKELSPGAPTPRVKANPVRTDASRPMHTGEDRPRLSPTVKTSVARTR